MPEKIEFTKGAHNILLDIRNRVSEEEFSKICDICRENSEDEVTKKEVIEASQKVAGT